MEGINTVEAKDPETTEQKMPFEIVIRTFDPEYLAHGAEPEQVIPCRGYMLCATLAEGGQTVAQGLINERAVVSGIAKHIDHKELFMMAALGVGDE